MNEMLIDSASRRVLLAMQLFTEVSAMNAENEQRKVLGQSMAYTEEQYQNVLQYYHDVVKDLY